MLPWTSVHYFVFSSLSLFTIAAAFTNALSSIVRSSLWQNESYRTRYGLVRNPLLLSQRGTHKAVPVTCNLKEIGLSTHKFVFFVVVCAVSKRSEFRTENRFTISNILETLELKSIMRLVFEIQFFNTECEMETHRELW